MKQTLISIVLLFSFFINVTAQIQEKKITSKNIDPPKAKEGTYQFIYHPSKKKYLFTTETLVEIERKRDKKEVKLIWLNPFVEVKILPTEYIESPNFIPIPEVKYVDQ